MSLIPSYLGCKEVLSCVYDSELGKLTRECRRAINNTIKMLSYEHTDSIGELCVVPAAERNVSGVIAGRYNTSLYAITRTTWQDVESAEVKDALHKWVTDEEETIDEMRNIIETNFAVRDRVVSDEKTLDINMQQLEVLSVAYTEFLWSKKYEFLGYVLAGLLQGTDKREVAGTLSKYIAIIRNAFILNSIVYKDALAEAQALNILTLRDIASYLTAVSALSERQGLQEYDIVSRKSAVKCFVATYNDIFNFMEPLSVQQFIQTERYLKRL